jgi:hypothetical protein
VLLGVLVMGAMTPFALKMYKSTHRELEDMSTFGRGKGGARGVEGGEGADAPALGRRPPARALKAKQQAAKEKEREQAAAEAGESTPRDLVWDAISSSNGSWSPGTGWPPPPASTRLGQRRDRRAGVRGLPRGGARPRRQARVPHAPA